MKPEVTSQEMVGEKQKRGYIRIKRPPPKPKAASKSRGGGRISARKARAGGTFFSQNLDDVILG